MKFCYFTMYKSYPKKVWSHHFGRYHDLVDLYEISSQQMTTDIPFQSYNGCDLHWLRLCLLSNTTGATIEAGVAYPSGASELILVFVGFLLPCFSFQCSVVRTIYDCLLFLFCWSWSCLSSDLPILSIPLVYSNSFYIPWVRYRLVQRLQIHLCLLEDPLLCDLSVFCYL